MPTYLSSFRRRKLRHYAKLLWLLLLLFSMQAEVTLCARKYLKYNYLTNVPGRPLGLRMYHRSRTVAHTASQWRRTRWARGFSQNDVMAAILKVWRHIRNPTLSVDAYSLARNNPVKFHPDRIWNEGPQAFLEKVAPTRRSTTTMMSSDTDHYLIQKESSVLHLHRVGKKKPRYSGHNFHKFRHSFVIFGMNHPDTSVY